MVPAYEGDKKYIFVSYAHRNSKTVIPFIEKLYTRKYRVWYDEGIAPGSEWPKNISDHLNGSSAVLYFISNDSLSSPNCENEVKSACNSEKLIFEYSLDGSNHPLLDSAKKISDERELFLNIPEDFIGDGTGYDRIISGKKFGTLWNVLLISAALFVIILGVALIGLNNGWFDKYLPGMNAQNEVTQKTTTEVLLYDDTVDFNDNTLEGAIAAQVGKAELYTPIQFNSDDEKLSLYNAVGWDRNNNGMTYEDLAHMENDNLCLEYASGKILECIKYMPKLKEISIRSADEIDLNLLKECTQLEKVNLDYTVFPVEIPENAKFRIMVFR